MFRFRSHLLLFVLLFFSGCAKRILMSDKDIRAYYSNSCNAPTFGSYVIDGHTVHYAESGCDTLPLVVFIHGAPGAWYGYIHYLDDTMLLRHVHMLSVDRPGYGKSDYGASLTSIEEQARLLEPLLQAKRNKQPVILVGRSYGGPVAARMAMDVPTQVDAMILLAPALDPEHEKYFWFNKPAKTKLVRWLLPKAFNVATDEKYTHAVELKKMEPLWPKVNMPVTVMQGSADHIVDTVNFHYAQRMLPATNNHFVYLPGYSHFIAAEHPEIVKTEILRYVSRFVTRPPDAPSADSATQK